MMRWLSSIKGQLTASFVYSDGGRSSYFSGKDAGDCAARAIAIATQQDYQSVYQKLAALNKANGGKKSARDGLPISVIEEALRDFGFERYKAPQFKGRKARPSDLPKGWCVARQSKHVVAVKNGICYDTFDSSKKMVYFYWAKK